LKEILPMARIRILPTTAATAAAAAFTFGLTLTASSAPALAAPAPPGDRVPITSANALVPAGATDEGTAPATGALDIRVYLSGRNQAGLRTLARQVSTPGDQHYRHFLTPAQYAATFGPTTEQRTAVTSWLRGCGFSVTGGNTHYVGASGDQAAVECATDAPMHVFRWRGTTVRAPAGRLSVPQAVADDVLSISGLSTLTTKVRPATTGLAGHPAAATAAATTCSSYWGESPATTVPPAYGATRPWHVCGYLPSQLRSAYGVTGTGLTGTGIKVAVVGAFASDTVASDVQTYASRHGEQAWASGQLTQVVPDGLPPQPSSWTMEEIMDVEAVHAIAPSAGVVYVASADAEDNSFVDAISRIVDGRLADIVSGSWVLGADTGIPSATVLAFEQNFLQGAVEGIGFFFASGDEGSQAASGDGSGPLITATEYPASDPWVTAVGGTTLAIGAGGQYLWETGRETDYAQLSDDGGSWVSPPGTFSGGSGGGASGLFRRPWYQPGTPRAASTDNAGARRIVPDVSMVADPVTGMLVGQTFALPTGGVYVEFATGGTSLSAPLFAGVQALAQQRAGHALGFANPAIYRAAASGGFRDVTDTPPGVTTPLAAVHTVTTVSPTGQVTTTFVLATLGRAQDTGLATTVGFDNVTGVGSPTSRYINIAGRPR
jgi:subtilase family serine protease